MLPAYFIYTGDEWTNIKVSAVKRDQNHVLQTPASTLPLIPQQADGANAPEAGCGVVY